MKHRLQWKLVVIMFVSLLCGVVFLGASQAIVLGQIGGMTAEEAEQAYPIVFDLLFMAATSGIFLLLSRRVVRRIEQMNQNVQQIAEGNRKQLLQDKRQDELGNLSRNIYEMARKIDKSEERQREMVCTVAHDLRTPVTSIRGYIKLLKENMELSEENKQYIGIIEQKSKDLSEQIGELLEYSVLQFEEKEYEREPLSLSQLVEQVLVEFIPLLDQEGMTFSFSGSQNRCEMPCNQILMVRLFENLFTNSIRYGKEGGVLEVLMEEEETTCRVTVSNYGESLSEEELEHVFEAFHQGANAKEYRTQSKGLGLAIAKKIVGIHKGTILAKSDENTGKVTFLIEFPKSL